MYLMPFLPAIVGRFHRLALLFVLLCGAALPVDAQPLLLWYERPAAQWVESLPVGNGRLGAMSFGGIEQERLQLNEDTLWAGGPYHPANPAARAALPSIRQRLADGDYKAAQDLVQAQFMGQPIRQMSYQTLGDLIGQTKSHHRQNNAVEIERNRRETSLPATKVSMADDGTCITCP